MTQMTYGRIAVAIDGSVAAQAAIDVALNLIEPDGEIGFVHAVDRMTAIRTYVPRYEEASGASAAVEKFERELFHAACEQAASRGIRSIRSSVDASAVAGIGAFARQFAPDVIVMGTHSDRGIARRALGSTAQAVVRSAQVPVVITRGAESKTARAGLQTVMVAVDGSIATQGAIAAGIDLARRRGAGLIFVNVAEREQARRAAARTVASAACVRAAGCGVRAEAIVAHGRQADALCAAAEQHGADMLVLGTHGRIGAALRRRGSVAADVLAMAPCPVMVIPALRIAKPPLAVTA